MTRKDYVRIAEAIRFAYENSMLPVRDVRSYKAGVRRAAGELAYALAQDNKAFNEKRFLSACFPADESDESTRSTESTSK